MAEERKLFNFANPGERSLLLQKIGSLTGQWWITVKRFSNRRSLKANAYYWVAVVPAFQRFMRTQGQYFSDEEIHEFFLQEFSGRPVVNPKTGEVMRIVGKRSSKMDKEQFAQYVNDCIGWMQDKFQIPVDDPDTFATQQPKGVRAA